MDVDALLTTLLRRARRGGVAIQTGVAVDELVREGGRVQAYRRHLFVGLCTTPWHVGAPFVWSLADEFYVRREADGLLASPCDDTVWTADRDSPPRRCVDA